MKSRTPFHDWEQRLFAAIEKVPETRFPIVVELAGMPRLGKTTFADSLISLLKKAGFTTMLSSFATHSSPIHERWSDDFSAWTLFSFLKNYLELRQGPTQFIIADRGMFDSITWLRIKSEKAKANSPLLNLLRQIAMSKPWIENHCLILAFVGENEFILRRHYERQIYEGDGLVSTERVLTRIAKSIESEAEIWNSKGHKVETFRVGDESIESRNNRAIEVVITSIESFASK